MTHCNRGYRIAASLLLLVISPATSANAQVLGHRIETNRYYDGYGSGYYGGYGRGYNGLNPTDAYLYDLGMGTGNGVRSRSFSTYGNGPYGYGSGSEHHFDRYEVPPNRMYYGGLRNRRLYLSTFNSSARPYGYGY